MEQSGNGVISQNDLMMKLAQAKKVMNKVEGSSPNSNRLSEERSRLIDDDDDYGYPITNMPEFINEAPNPASLNVSQAAFDIDKINKTKLPDAIKKAMIERPIAQADISLSDGIDMKIIKGAKRLIEQDSPKPQQRKQIVEQARPQQLSNDFINTLIPIIENTVRKVMDEKLNQLLTAQQTTTINENLVLKVGDSIFKGRITGVNKSK